MQSTSPQATFSVHDLILGAGLAGIGYATHTTSPYRVLEKENFVGGVASSRIHRGYTFDCTGHWLHIKNPEIKTWVERLFPEGLLEIARQAEVHLYNQRTPYPFQANTYGLPRNIVSDCVLGYFKARERQAAGLFSPPESFEDFIRQRMGDGIAEHFMLPYNTKMWTIPPSEMSYKWCGRFVPLPTPEEIVEGALTPSQANRALGYNSRFFYPKKGGMGELANRLSKTLQPNLSFHSRATQIDWKNKIVHLENAQNYSYQRLISTIPLPQLVHTLIEAPQAVLDAVQHLRSTSVSYWNIGFKGAARADAPHWIYFPEPHIPFYRVGSPSAAVPSTAPPGYRSYYVETSHPTGTPNAIDDHTILDGLRQVGLASPQEEPDFIEQFTIPCAYVIMDHAYESNRAIILNWLKDQAIWSIGRYGSWIYDSMEGSLLQGKQLAQRLN